MSQEQNNRTVKVGMLIGAVLTLILYSSAYQLVSPYTNEVQLVERIQLGFKCLLFPGLFLLGLVFRVGAQRFGSPAENPTLVKANTEGMEIDLCVLSNTHEQVVIFAINALGLAIFLPFQYLSLLPIYSLMFVLGRVLFWLGYRYNILWRAPGFGMTIFPAVAGLLYCCSRLVMDLFT